MSYCVGQSEGKAKSSASGAKILLVEIQSRCQSYSEDFQYPNEKTFAVLRKIDTLSRVAQKSSDAYFEREGNRDK